MIKPNQIIKHIRAMDVCFLVDKVRGPYGPNQRVELTGEWINMGFEKSFLIGERQKIKMTLAKSLEWQICMDPAVECLRYAEWK